MPRPRTALGVQAAVVAVTLVLGIAAATPEPDAPTALAAAGVAVQEPVPSVLTPMLDGAAPVELAPTVEEPEPEADVVAPTRRVQPRPTRIRAPRAAPSCPAAPAVPATRSTRARVVVSGVDVYDAPGAARPARRMSNPREEDGLPLDFLVRARRGEWIQVQLPVRPNFTRGWIRVRDVELSGLPYRIVVERCARRMTLYRDGQVVMREVVAVGQPRYPTPLGEFYVDYIYPFSMRSGYGPWLVSIAGFSDVLTNFAGGRGQLALHGTAATSSLGKAASHGCVRLSPAASTRLADLVKPGTPVSIVA